MTGTIRNRPSLPRFATTNHEKVAKRRRSVGKDYQEWMVRRSSGRNHFHYCHMNRHGHRPHMRFRQVRRADSARKRFQVRCDRRLNYKLTFEDNLSSDDQMLEDELCFTGNRDRQLQAETERMIEEELTSGGLTPLLTRRTIWTLWTLVNLFADHCAIVLIACYTYLFQRILIHIQ